MTLLCVESDFHGVSFPHSLGDVLLTTSVGGCFHSKACFDSIDIGKNRGLKVVSVLAFANLSLN
jgi:hypothetical protein